MKIKFSKKKIIFFIGLILFICPIMIIEIYISSNIKWVTQNYSKEVSKAVIHPNDIVIYFSGYIGEDQFQKTLNENPSNPSLLATQKIYENDKILSVIESHKNHEMRSNLGRLVLNYIYMRNKFKMK